MVLFVGGCATPYRPPSEHIQLVEHSTRIDLREYGVVRAPGTWTYERRDARQPSASPDKYPVRITSRSRSDGAWAEDPEWDVPALIAARRRAIDEHRIRWPDDRIYPEGDGAGFLMSFDPPLAAWPSELQSDRPFESRAKVTFYNRNGRKRFRGDAERTVRFEGFETLRIQDMDYAECARLTVTTTCRVALGPSVTLTEYVWLARGIGEVQRVEHIGGVVFLTTLDEARLYQLVEAPSAPHPKSAASEPPAWSHAAVYLDELTRDPQIGSLFVAFANQPSPASSGTLAEQPPAWFVRGERAN